MPYSVIALVASVALCVYYVAVTEASGRSKVAVSVIVLASLIVWRYRPQWLVLATLLQAATGIYVLIYFKVTRESR